jgi:hypothetical protein
MTRPGVVVLAVLALLRPWDLSAQRTASIAATATVVAAPAARVSARLVQAALKESPNSRVRRREGLVWVDAEAPRGGRRRITVNHLAN